MTDKKNAAQRLGLVLERMTRQTGRVTDTSEYGSWILGRVSESQQRRRVRIQLILTTVVLGANLARCRGRVPRRDASPSRCPVSSTPQRPVDHLRGGAGLYRAGLRGGRRLGDQPGDQQRPVGHRGARTDAQGPAQHLLRAVAAEPRPARAVGRRHRRADLLYGLQDTDYIPKVLLGISFPGHRGVGLLLPVHRVRAAPRRRAGAGSRSCPRAGSRPASWGATLTVWALGFRACRCWASCWPPSSRCRVQIVSPTQFAVAVMILALFALAFGFLLMWILAWLTATPVRAVRVGAQPRRAGRLRHQPGGLRRHRTGPAAAGLQLDGRRSAGTRTGA